MKRSAEEIDVPFRICFSFFWSLMVVGLGLSSNWIIMEQSHWEMQEYLPISTGSGSGCRNASQRSGVLPERKASPLCRSKTQRPRIHLDGDMERL